MIGTFGMETIGKLSKMNVVIIGLRGLGVEVAKNLILAGPKQVSIFDPDLTRLNDLGANFFLEEQHVGQYTRADACLGKLQELNPYVTVEVVKSRKELEELLTSGTVHVCCQTEILLENSCVHPSDVNQICRNSNITHISSQTFGPWGYAFCDFGPEHTVTDHHGEQTKSFIVTMIEKGETTVVTTYEDKRHIYQEGDYVKFTEVEEIH